MGPPCGGSASGDPSSEQDFWIGTDEVAGDSMVTGRIIHVWQAA